MVAQGQSVVYREVLNFVLANTGLQSALGFNCCLAFDRDAGFTLEPWSNPCDLGVQLWKQNCPLIVFIAIFQTSI